MTRYLYKEGTGTRQSSTVRYPYDYSFWLTGYWDDFTSSRCMPDISSNDLTHTNTHHGNPMNAEARLNPHFRFSYADRAASFTSNNATTPGGKAVTYQTTSPAGKVVISSKLMHNNGMHEWVTKDDTRLSGYYGIARLEYVDSLAHANRSRFAGDGTLDSYLKITPSYSSTGFYRAHCGDVDSSFGRLDTYARMGEIGTAGDLELKAGVPNSSTGGAGVIMGNNKVYHTAEIKTASVFSTHAPSSHTSTSPYAYGARILSPSKTPFLVMRHTFPPFDAIQGGLSGGVWECATVSDTSPLRFRVGDIVHLGSSASGSWTGANIDICVIQSITANTGSAGVKLNLYDLRTSATWNGNKFNPSHGDFVGGSLTAIHLWKPYHPLIGYDGYLGFRKNYDVFHMRVAPISFNKNGLPNNNTASRYILRVGFNKSKVTMTPEGNRYEDGGNVLPSETVACMEIEIQPHEIRNNDYTLVPSMHQFILTDTLGIDKTSHWVDYDSTGTSHDSAADMGDVWQDWDIVPNFTAQNFQLYIDGQYGGQFNMSTKPGGGSWAATDLYGWHLDIGVTGKDGDAAFPLTGSYETFNTEVTLLDRVGVIEEITKPVVDVGGSSYSNSRTHRLVSDVSIKMKTNSTSIMQLTVIDDENERDFQNIFNDTPTNTRLLMFKDGIDNCLWSGFLRKVDVKQKVNLKEYRLSAADSLIQFDLIMPYWEVGQNFNTPNTTYVYRRLEAEMVTDIFNFGMKKLMQGSMFLGMDHQSRVADPYDTSYNASIGGRYGARFDSRTRLYSGNPIQIYHGQDPRGVAAHPDPFNTTPTAEHYRMNVWRQWATKEIIGFSDGSYHGEYYVVAHCIEHNLKEDDTFTIYGGSMGANAFTQPITNSSGDLGDDGLAITVKKVLDKNHFCFTYNSYTKAGRNADETAHFWSLVTSKTTGHGLGLSLNTTSAQINRNVAGYGTYDGGDAFFEQSRSGSFAALMSPYRRFGSHRTKGTAISRLQYTSQDGSGTTAAATAFTPHASYTAADSAISGGTNNWLKLDDVSDFSNAGQGFIEIRSRKGGSAMNHNLSATIDATSVRATSESYSFGTCETDHIAFGWQGRDSSANTLKGIYLITQSGSSWPIVTLPEGLANATAAGHNIYRSDILVYQTGTRSDASKMLNQAPVWEPHPQFYPNNHGQRRRHHMGCFDAGVETFYNGYASPFFFTIYDFYSTASNPTYVVTTLESIFGQYESKNFFGQATTEPNPNKGISTTYTAKPTFVSPTDNILGDFVDLRSRPNYGYSGSHSAYSAGVVHQNVLDGHVADLVTTQNAAFPTANTHWTTASLDNLVECISSHITAVNRDGAGGEDLFPWVNPTRYNTNFLGLGDFSFKKAGIIKMDATQMPYIHSENAHVTVGPRAVFQPSLTNNTPFSSRQMDWAMAYLDCDGTKGHGADGERSQIMTIAKIWKMGKWSGRFRSGTNFNNAAIGRVVSSNVNPGFTRFGYEAVDTTHTSGIRTYLNASGVNADNDLEYYGMNISGNNINPRFENRVSTAINAGTGAETYPEFVSVLLRGNEIDQFEPNNISTQPFSFECDRLYGHESAGTRMDAPSPIQDMYDIMQLDGVRLNFNNSTLSSVTAATVSAGSIHSFPDSGYGFVPDSGSGTNDAFIFRWTGRTVAGPTLDTVSIVAQGSSAASRSGLTGANVGFPLVFGVMSLGTAVFEPPAARKTNERYRPSHACYMHDLVRSHWFRTMFGIIEENAQGVHSPQYTMKALRTLPQWGELAGFSQVLLDNVTSASQLLQRYPTTVSNVQHSNHFEVATNYTAGATSMVITPHCAIPEIDDNFNEPRFLAKGEGSGLTNNSTGVIKGTDPTISIPSQGSGSSTANQTFKNYGLIFEMYNSDGSLDVGFATSAQMTSCKAGADFTHYEISRIKHMPAINLDSAGQPFYPSIPSGEVMVGELRLYGAYHGKAYYNNRGTTFADNWLFPTEVNSVDVLHSGNDDVPKGYNRGGKLYNHSAATPHTTETAVSHFVNINVGDVVYVGYIQGGMDMPRTDDSNKSWNPDNPYGEYRDPYSYRWYRVIGKTDEYLSVYPAEIAGQKYSDYGHPIGQFHNQAFATQNDFNLLRSHSATASHFANLNNSGKANVYVPDLYPFFVAGGGSIANPGEQITRMYCGNVTLSGVKLLTQNHLAGATGRFRIIRNDFRHCWALWSDMRNDGTADADGSSRITSFGLISPHRDNYKVRLVFARTQTDITELAVDEDIDMWDLGNNDPGTSAVWSANYTNTITSSIVSHLHNWESSAGSPLVIDASKFFNLNTRTNGGKIGQSSGGAKTVSDYVFESGRQDDIILTDNYWQQVAATPHTSKNRIPYDTNYKFWLNYETKSGWINPGRVPLFIIDSSSKYEGAYFGYRVYGSIENRTESNEEVTSYATTNWKGCLVSHYDEESQDEAYRLYFGGAKLKSSSETLAESFSTTYDWSNRAGVNPPDSNHAIFSTWSGSNALQQMMVIDGYVETTGGNTYYEHDKIRALWLLSSSDTWLSGSKPPCGYDIDGVPFTAFGSSMDARGESSLSIIKTMAEQAGDANTTFFYMIGKDNKFEFRPSYSMGMTLDRNNLRVSDFTTEASKQITHVRVYYNNTDSFVDYPTPILNEGDYRFKVIDAHEISSSAEANKIAERELARSQKEQLEITAEIIRESSQSHVFLDTGRHGYIASNFVMTNPGQIAISGTGVTNSHLFHSADMGGSIIGGRMNALDGNLDNLLYKRLGAQFGGSHDSDAFGDTWDNMFIGERVDRTFGNEGMGYHGFGNCTNEDSHPTRWEGQFLQYGLTSIDNAVQIVHIPKDTPKVSNTTSNSLRIFVSHNGDHLIGNYQVWLVDATYTNRIGAVTSTTRYTKTDITANGYHELSIPTSYGATSGAKIIISFNKDYCDALLKHKCNHPTNTSFNKGNRFSTPPGFSGALSENLNTNCNTSSANNENSAFPLGVPQFEDTGYSGAYKGPLWFLREHALFYSPSIEIVDDFVFRPGRTVRYTDANLDVDEVMTIKQVEWKQKEQEHERVKLTLQREEAQPVTDFSSFFGNAFSRPRGGTDVGEPGGGSGGGGGFPFGPRPSFPPGGGASGGYGGFPMSGNTVGSLQSAADGPANSATGSQFAGGLGIPNTPAGNSQMNQSKVGISGMSGTFNSMSKGSGDSYSDASEQGASGVLGMNRNAGHNNQESSYETKMDTAPSGGSSTYSTEGFTLPGISHTTSDGVPTQSDYHEGVAFTTLPQNVSNNAISVRASITAPENGVAFEIIAEIESEDSSYTNSNTVSITGSSDRQNITIFPSLSVKNLGGAGSRIKITLTRIPGGANIVAAPNGEDAAPHTSVIVHSMSMITSAKKLPATNKQNIMQSLINKDVTEGWISGTDNSWKGDIFAPTRSDSGSPVYGTTPVPRSDAIKGDDEV